MSVIAFLFLPDEYYSNTTYHKGHPRNFVGLSVERGQRDGRHVRPLFQCIPQNKDVGDGGFG
jgi:hypothetical protein